MKYFVWLFFIFLGGCQEKRSPEYAIDIFDDMPPPTFRVFFMPPHVPILRYLDNPYEPFARGVHTGVFTLRRGAFRDLLPAIYRWELAFAADHPNITATWKIDLKGGKYESYIFNFNIGKNVPLGMHRFVFSAIGYDQQGKEIDREYTAQFIKLEEKK